MKTRAILTSICVVAATLTMTGQSRPAPKGRAAGPRSQRPAAFELIEATIPQMRTAMAAGRLTSRELVTRYLTRIGLYENRLHAADRKSVV